MTLDQEWYNKEELAALLGVSAEHVQRLHKRKLRVAEIDRVDNPPVIIARWKRDEVRRFLNKDNRTANQPARIIRRP